MNVIFLQAEGGFFSNPMNMVLISAFLFVMYFFMLRPNQKKAKEAQELLDGLAPGSKIITAGGVHGKVKRVDETTVLIEISNNNLMTIEKTAISPELTAKLNKPAEEKK